MRAIIWVRTSTAEQEIETQEKTLTKWANELGYNELTIIGKQGASARKADAQYQKEVEELLSTLASTGIKCVFVREVSRLARKLEYFNKMVEYIIPNKIQLYCKVPEIKLFNDDGSLNNGAEMMLHILAVVAKQEMEIKDVRFGEKKSAMRSAGKLTEGKPLFGYSKVKGGSVVINEEEAEKVRYIINAYATTDITLNALAQDIIAKGILPLNTTRSAAYGMVSRTINNLAYSGRNEKTQVNYPPIVSEVLQEKAINKCKNRRKEFKNDTKYIYYCKGIIRSKSSGKVLMAKRYSVAYITTDDDEGVKMNLSINAMDSLVWRLAKHYKSIMINLDKSKNKEQYRIGIDKNNDEINTLDKLIKDIQDKRKKAQLHLATDRISVEVYDELNKGWTKDESIYQKKVAELKSLNQQYKGFIEQLDTADDENSMLRTKLKLDEVNDDRVKRNIIKEMIKNLWIERLSKSQYRITYELNIPLTPLPYIYYYESKGGRIKLQRYYAYEDKYDDLPITKRFEYHKRNKK